MYHILVVDDEARIRGIIRKYAEFEGHEVTEAADGMQAVLLCRSNTYDIIIMDIMMPELDGFSACREIRKTTQTPIIMLSARGEEYDRINGFEVGIDDYVVKPSTASAWKCRPKNTTGSSTCSPTATSRSRGKSCSARSGAMTFTAMPGRWIRTSNCCARAWDATQAIS